MRYGYLIEMKYIARSEFDDKRLKQAISEAEQQLQQYANDERIQQVIRQVPVKKLALVYKGWELVYREEWREEAKA